MLGKRKLIILTKDFSKLLVESGYVVEERNLVPWKKLAC
jgi:hypothetical protein